MSAKPGRTIPVLLALVVGLWAAPARADVFTVDWDVVPHDFQDIHHGDSPFYDCDGSLYGNRLCYSLWDTGLTLERVLYSFYDDRFFDGSGLGVPESFIGPGYGVMRIVPECKAGLSPCFESFTPLSLTMSSFSFGPPPNLFVLSSRGGLVKTADDSVPIVFAGSAWQNLDWIEVGFYFPDFCWDDEPPEGTESICSANTEKALAIDGLTFEADAVPEPALLSLLAAGALGLGIRRRRRA